MKTLAALSVLAISLVFTGCDNGGRYGRGYGPPQAGAPPIGYGDQGYGYQDARQMGHRDGIQAAYQDLRERRSPDARRHSEYRRPPVDNRARDQYRNGFVDGYGVAYRRGTYSGSQRDRDDDDRR